MEILPNSESFVTWINSSRFWVTAKMETPKEVSMSTDLGGFLNKEIHTFENLTIATLPVIPLFDFREGFTKKSSKKSGGG